jgi:hypothetical protein
MGHRLEIFFNDVRKDNLRPKNSPVFYYTAKFSDLGIECYGNTMQIAVDKAVEMLKILQDE